MAVESRTLARGVLGKEAGLARRALLVLGFSVFIALSAQIAVPFWPVPVTGQTLAVLLAGAALGPRLGVLAVLAYIAEGLAGLPVFAAGAAAWQPTRLPGVPYILGPTAGYLAGFVVAAGVVGWLAERGWDRSLGRAALAMVLGQLVIYAFGLAWLARFVPLDGLLAAGVLPFLPGDAVKIGLAAVALPGAWSLVGGRSQE
jgi:biotin transport system substrate-specific component